MSKKLKRDSKKLDQARGPLTGKRKSFSQETFNRFNSLAVAAVVHYLDSVDVWAKPNDDHYGPDLVIWRGFRPVSYLEIEVRAGWDGGQDWPLAWDPVNIPERKLRHYTLSMPCEHWILSADLSKALILPDMTVREFGRLGEFKNSQIAAGEMFVRIPLAECIRKELIDGQL